MFGHEIWYWKAPNSLWVGTSFTAASHEFFCGPPTQVMWTWHDQVQALMGLFGAAENPTEGIALHVTKPLHDI